MVETKQYRFSKNMKSSTKDNLMGWIFFAIICFITLSSVSGVIYWAKIIRILK